MHMFCAWMQAQQAQACQHHVGIYLQLWIAYNTNNTNNICFAPMPWAAGIQYPAYDAKVPKACTCLPCFRMLHILWGGSLFNHGKGARLVF